MRWAVLVGVVTTVLVLGLLSLFYTVAADAKARGSGAWLSWGVTAVFVPFGPALYLLYRFQMGERTASLTRRERLAGTGTVVFLIAGYLLVWRWEWSLPRRRPSG